MTKQHSSEQGALEQIYRKLADWFEQFEQHEMTSAVEIVEKAKAYFWAAESIPAEKVKQFTDNLEYDLQQFYTQYQSEAQHSVYLGLLNERFWQSLGQITDRAQVEWAELLEDFQHNGSYHSGDMIGFGVLSCQRCHQTLTIYHLSEVPQCPNCGHDSFTRLSLAP